MATYFPIVISIGGAFFLVGGFYLYIQLFKNIKIDAQGRGFIHPNQLLGLIC